MGGGGGRGGGDGGVCGGGVWGGDGGGGWGGDGGGEGGGWLNTWCRRMSSAMSENVFSDPLSILEILIAKRNANKIRYMSLILIHYNDVLMRAVASQITGLSIVYSTAGSGTDERKHQSSASLAFVRGIHRWPVNSPHKRPVTRKMFPFDDVIMWWKRVYSLGCNWMVNKSQDSCQGYMAWCKLETSFIVDR